MTVPIHQLHEHHPQIRAEDWRSPLVARLTHEATYADGNAVLSDSFRPVDANPADGKLPLTWSGLQTDYERCLKTYQTPVLTEYAALAVACILVNKRAGLEITEVTRRGDKVDYWIGDRQLLLEVSGTQTGDLAALCDSKATEQILKNPFKKDGFVCVSRFGSPAARLWYYKYPSSPS
jgi:hypothetical protein